MELSTAYRVSIDMIPNVEENYHADIELVGEISATLRRLL